MAFLGAIIVSVFVFFISIMLMIISIILIFGFYLLKEYGFWPITWTSSAFKSVVSGAKIDSATISSFVGVRVFLIILCILIFILSIVSLSLCKSANKEGYKGKQGLSKSFASISLVLSIFGLLSAIMMLLIVASI